MSRASADLVDLIHNLAATALKDEIERAMERAALSRSHEDYAPINPQLLDKALKFLKDNGVDAPAKSPRVDSLAAKLAGLQLDLDDEAGRLAN